MNNSNSTLSTTYLKHVLLVAVSENKINKCYGNCPFSDLTEAQPQIKLHLKILKLCVFYYILVLPEDGYKLYPKHTEWFCLHRQVQLFGNELI
jgi:hypothetical protein